MITKLSTYITKNTIPYKNLAMEEYLTFHAMEGECILFLWQNRHTVVIGKNQNCWKECKVHYLEEDGGYLVRRLSGGGAAASRGSSPPHPASSSIRTSGSQIVFFMAPLSSFRVGCSRTHFANQSS